MAKRKSRSRSGPDTATSPSARMLDTLHRIWLAGLGAAVKAQRGAPQLMEDLVEEGARVHSETRGAAERALRALLGNTKTAFDARFGQVKGHANDALENLERIFQTRVQRMLRQIGVPSADEVESLSTRVSELNDSVKQLARIRDKTGRLRPHAGRKAPAAAVSAS